MPIITRTLAVAGQTVLQQVIDAESYTLRPLRRATPNLAIAELTREDYIYAVGTPTAHTFYTLDDLIRSPALRGLGGYAQDSDDPLYFPSRCAELPHMMQSDLSDVQYETLILLMLGLPTTHLSDEAKADTLRVVHDSGHAVASSKELSRLFAPPDNLEPPIDLGPIDPRITLLELPIRKLNEDEYAAAIRGKTAVRRGSSQRRWPWKKMEPRDEVVIPAPLAAKAQRSVHSYGASTGKLFRTKRNAHGELIVICEEGTRPVVASSYA